MKPDLIHLFSSYFSGHVVNTSAQSVGLVLPRGQSLTSLQPTSGESVLLVVASAGGPLVLAGQVDCMADPTQPSPTESSVVS